MSLRPMPLALLLALSGCAKKVPETATPPVPEARCGAKANGEQTFVVLHLNDVYRIEGLLDDSGGIARVRQVRKALEADCSQVLVTHGGDFLSPSLLTKSTNWELDGHGSKTLGRHMVDLLSWLDGDGEAFDPQMFVTLGNHEFDNGAMKYAEALTGNLDASGFVWLDTNLTWLPEDAPAVSSEHLAHHRVIELGALKVGLFGMTLFQEDADYELATMDPDYAGQARRVLAEMTEAHGELDVVIAVTHLPVADDLALLEAVPEIDVVLGGHDHQAMTRSVADGRQVLKADADAATVRVVEITHTADGEVRVTPESESGRAVSGEADAEVQAEVDRWMAQLGVDFCGEADPDCLDAVYGTTGNVWLAGETEIRRFETNLGDHAADLALAAYADSGAQLAFVNSGSIRLNQDLPEGWAVQRRQVEELFPYPMPLRLIEITGANLEKVAGRSVQAWEGNGHWLQVSGWGFRHDPATESATGLVLIDNATGATTPIDPEQTYRAVAPNYLVEGNDGYSADWWTDITLSAVHDGEQMPDLKVRFGEDLKTREVTTLEVAGRVCNPQRPEAPCLVPASD